MINGAIVTMSEEEKVSDVSKAVDEFIDYKLVAEEEKYKDQLVRSVFLSLFEELAPEVRKKEENIKKIAEDAFKFANIFMKVREMVHDKEAEDEAEDNEEDDDE